MICAVGLCRDALGASGSSLGADREPFEEHRQDRTDQPGEEPNGERDPLRQWPENLPGESDSSDESRSTDEDPEDLPSEEQNHDAN